MFDPYQKWLGIPSKDQPPNHYRLLGVELFETDFDVIDGGADRVMTYIRKYQSGEHANEAAKLLNDIAAARLCLLRPEKKAVYDARLKQEIEARTPMPVKDVFDDLELAAPPPRARALPRPPSRKSTQTTNNAPVLPISIVVVTICVLVILWIVRGRNESAKPRTNENSSGSVTSDSTERQTPKETSVEGAAGSPPTAAPVPTVPSVTETAAPKVPAVGLVRSWKGKLGHSQARTFSEDGKRLIYFINQDVFLMDTETGEIQATLEGNTKSVWTARFCEGDTHVVSVGPDETIRIWNLSDFKMESTLPKQTPKYGTIVGASRSASQIVFTSEEDKQISVMDRQSGNVLRNISLSGEQGTFRAVSRDLRFALSNGAGSQTFIWDLKTGTSESIDNGQGNDCGDFSFDCTQVIVGGERGWNIWDIESKSLVQKAKQGEEYVCSVATNPEMTRMVTGHDHGTIWLSDLKSGKKVMSFLGHENRIRTTKISPDSHYAISMDNDYMLSLWRLPD